MQGYVLVGEVDSKGKARKLSIKADIKKMLCFPGASKLMVSHLKKDLLNCINSSLDCQIPNSDAKFPSTIPDSKSICILRVEFAQKPLCQHIATNAAISFICKMFLTGLLVLLALFSFALETLI